MNHVVGAPMRILPDGAPHTYRLENRVAVHEPDLQAWAAWYESIGMGRIVAQTQIGDVRVSTVFLGFDPYAGHRPDGPFLFESLIFGGPLDGMRERCSTWNDAERAHQELVEWAKTGPRA